MKIEYIAALFIKKKEAMKFSPQKWSLVLFFVFCTSLIVAQEKQPLPKGLTQEEKGILSNFEFRNNQMTDPPSGPVRAAAEWEEVEYFIAIIKNCFICFISRFVNLNKY